MQRSASVSASTANAQMGRLLMSNPATANVLINFTVPGRESSTQTVANVSAEETKPAKLRLNTTRNSVDVCAHKNNTVHLVKCSATKNVGVFAFFREIALSPKSSIPRPANVNAQQLSYARLQNSSVAKAAIASARTTIKCVFTRHKGTIRICVDVNVPWFEGVHLAKFLTKKHANVNVQHQSLNVPQHKCLNLSPVNANA